MAIDDLLDEHEQSERVRNWLRANAAGLIGGIALGLALIYGWLWWKDRAVAERQQASDRYNKVVQQVRAGKLKEAQTAAADLKGSAFEPILALELAKAQLVAGKRDDAIATLRGIRTDDAALAAVVQQRLARVLIDAGKSEEALKLLESADDAPALEVRGDALFALGRHEQAREAYRKALSKLDVAAEQRRIVELKLSQAGGTPPKPQTDATKTATKGA